MTLFMLHQAHVFNVHKNVKTYQINLLKRLEELVTPHLTYITKNLNL